MKRAIATLAALAALLSAAPAQAAFPGTNGKIAFHSDRDGDFDIYVMNPDGTGQTPLTFNTSSDRAPAWSPDGRQIAYMRSTELWVMDADGQNAHLVAGSAGGAPAWSPDGTQIVFEDSPDLGVVNADGTNRRFIDTTTDPFQMLWEQEPAWSPSGAEIAYANHVCADDTETCNLAGDVRAVKPDGSGLRIVSSYRPDWDQDAPNWSPAGDKLAFGVCSDEPDVCSSQEVWVVDASGANRHVVPGTLGRYPTQPAFSPDGAHIVHNATSPTGGASYNVDIAVDGTRITTNAGRDENPDWQPIPVNTYVRPRSANWVEVSLVPAYQLCTAPNRNHGPPLAYPSCAPPQPVSGATTVGSSATGFVVYGVQSGNPATQTDEADVQLKTKITDVRDAGTLDDYSGTLSVRTSIRVTDKYNAATPNAYGAATVADGALSFDVPCTITASTTIGSTCAINSSADALVAGTVKERMRSMWELKAVEVRDAGGQAFMKQGVFVP
jgi:TolB protein